MLVFVEGGKPEHPEKTPWSKDKNQQQTQPTYGLNTGNRVRATLAGGKCSHHCAIPVLPLHGNMHHNPVEHADRVSKLDPFLALPKLFLARVAYIVTEKHLLLRKQTTY